jgi:hypothetical protein
MMDDRQRSLPGMHPGTGSQGTALAEARASLNTDPTNVS